MKDHTLTKSDYLKFLDCPEELWLKKNDRKKIPPINENKKFVYEQGNLIDALAQQLFIGENVEYQKEIKVDNLLARADIVTYNKQNNSFNIYEVKASTKVKPENYDDVAFQKTVFELGGLTVSKVHVIYINNQYAIEEPIDVRQLFSIKNVTRSVIKLQSKTKSTINEALSFINGPKPSKKITFCRKKLECPFVLNEFTNLPDYSIWNIAGLRDIKRKELVARNIFSITDVPDDFDLNENQKQQVKTAKEGIPVIDKIAIKNQLDRLKFPLYFIDYESLPYVIPLQVGYRPYQQMVFQYSLHTISAPNEEPKHSGYLMTELKETTAVLLAHLKKDIKEKGGSIIVWNKTFERERNREMAIMFPKYANLLHSMNDRIYDLMTPFNKKMYVDPAFKGRTSLKSVLPVLVPDLSYTELAINNGSDAFYQWFSMIKNNLSQEQKESITENLEKYCFLDTWAMVKIWEVLKSL